MDQVTYSPNIYNVTRDLGTIQSLPKASPSHDATLSNPCVQPVQFWLYTLIIGLVTANILVRLGFASVWFWLGTTLLPFSPRLFGRQYSADLYEVVQDLTDDIRVWARSSREDSCSLREDNAALRKELAERPTQEDHKNLQSELSLSQLNEAHARNYTRTKDKELAQTNEAWSKVNDGDLISSQQLRIHDLESEVERINKENVSLKGDLRDSKLNEASSRQDVAKHQKDATYAHSQQQAQIIDLTTKTQILERINSQQEIKLEQFADVMEMLNRLAEEENNPQLRSAAVLFAKTMKQADMDLGGINISEQKLEALYNSMIIGPGAAVQPKGGFRIEPNWEPLNGTWTSRRLPEVQIHHCGGCIQCKMGQWSS
ncbi:hypothetical protein K491DRAFT_775488 [Lophiostoma macrostomum CBS 122681]|uniref:Uncharacterized protein n=1 Tax=Lophiostoma macrostomum CBS 122681 TaxID=1314788 RepID=A0A6A6THR1_9PLEO|nr:hypothetical protein K491DRAFT_775488 [Lophiostoma macrostomum CBS 122681]